MALFAAEPGVIGTPGVVGRDDSVMGYPPGIFNVELLALESKDTMLGSVGRLNGSFGSFPTNFGLGEGAGDVPAIPVIEDNEEVGAGKLAAGATATGDGATMLTFGVTVTGDATGVGEPGEDSSVGVLTGPGDSARGEAGAWRVSRSLSSSSSSQFASASRSPSPSACSSASSELSSSSSKDRMASLDRTVPIPSVLVLKRNNQHEKRKA